MAAEGASVDAIDQKRDDAYPCSTVEGVQDKSRRKERGYHLRRNGPVREE
jgi:hypothetical protein